MNYKYKNISNVMDSYIRRQFYDKVVASIYSIEIDKLIYLASKRLNNRNLENMQDCIASSCFTEIEKLKKGD